MTPETSIANWDALVGEFNLHNHRTDGAPVAGSLAGGLALLRESLYLRLHEDVEKIVGTDSMLMPVSETRAKRQTQAEIQLFQVAESALTIRQSGYLAAEDGWCVAWLGKLVLPEPPGDSQRKRLDEYLAKGPRERELVLADVLAKVLPESRRAPLVLFRLFPLAVQLATAQAFGDQPGAAKIRSQQAHCLPAVNDCAQCHGQVLENGEECRSCGNPLWKTEWLNAT